MRTRITGLIGLGTLMLSALGQEISDETAKTNVIEAVPEAALEITNTLAAEWSVRLGTNTMDVSAEDADGGDGAAELLGPKLSSQLVERVEAPDAIESGKAVYKGPVIVFFKKQNPLAVFNPFRPVKQGEDTERPLWDPYLGAPRGIVLFSAHR